MTLDDKHQALLGALRAMESVMVAYSGGVDSALLARAAHEALGDRMLAVIARSPSYPEAEYREAVEVARAAGFPFREIRTQEVDDPRYAANPADRCFFCKKELFAKLGPLAAELGYRILAYGSIVEDLADHRPGRRAAELYEVRAPLEEAGLSKAEIRELSRRYGLATAEKQSFACLSSRIPYGEEITPGKLARVERAEQFLRDHGFRTFRVRSHEDLARIEVDPADLPRCLELRVPLLEWMRSAGFRHVTLDLAGFRSGSMNEGLELRVISGER